MTTAIFSIFSLLGLADAPDGWQDLLSDSDEGGNDGDGDNAFDPDLDGVFGGDGDEGGP